MKKILRGRQREETERIIAFRSNWGCANQYCTPGRGHEKGGVEGELGWWRRNDPVPGPEAGDLAGLNELLLARSWESQSHTISGRTMTIGPAMEQERRIFCRWPRRVWNWRKRCFRWWTARGACG